MQHSAAKRPADECGQATPLQDVQGSLNQGAAGKGLHDQHFPGKVSADCDSPSRGSLYIGLPDQAIPNKGLPCRVSPGQDSTERSSRSEVLRGQDSKRRRSGKRHFLRQRVPSEDVQQEDATGAAAPRLYPPLPASCHQDPEPGKSPRPVDKEESERSSLRSNGKYIKLMPLLKLPVIAFVVMVFIVFLTAWNSTVRPRAVKERTEACIDSACLRHANEIKRAWNLSVHPCDNFYNFVCGTWTAQEIHRLMDDLATGAKGIALAELLSGSRTATKAKKFFRSCVEAASDVQSNLDLFKKWASTIGVIQPRSSSQAQNKARRHPLDLLLDLAINWRTGLLSIHARSRFNKSQWTLIIKPVPGPWRTFLESEDLVSLVGQHAEILDVWPPRHWDEWNRTVAAIQTAISTGSDGSQFFGMAATISDLDGLTPKLRQGLWLDLINEHFAPELKFLKGDFIIAHDTEMLINIGSLFRTLSVDPFTEVISWIVVETYVSLMVPAPGLRGGEVASPRSQDDCLSYTNLFLGPLSLQQYLQQQFPRQKRQSVNALLEHIRETWAVNLEHAPWIDEASKQRVLKKAEALKTVLWPSDEFLNSATSRALYSSFPNMDKPFVANLIETATTLRRLVNHSHFEDVYSRQILGESHLFLYRYFLNEVYIDLAALNAPVYYDVEMFAIRYGALGSLYAKEVTKMYDSNGRQLGADGEYDGYSPSEESSEYRKKLLCNATGDRHPPFEYFTHISGLETVFQAYSVASTRNSRHYDYRLYGLEDLTSDQLFFVTYCHMLCAPSTDDEAEHMCNIPLQNFRPLAEAFRCKTGSYMNPEKKCRFFALTAEQNATCGCR